MLVKQMLYHQKHFTEALGGMFCILLFYTKRNLKTSLGSLQKLHMSFIIKIKMHSKII